MHEDIYERLKEVAREGETITYDEIAPLADLDMRQPADRFETSRILTEICLSEHEEGRPMLCAVAVRRDTGRPGQGFFKLARLLDIYPDHEADDRAFFQKRAS
jgi:hypothetical protein